jgi:hypothetical protein
MIDVKALSLMELKSRLRIARDEYELCSFIDHYPDVLRCRERCQVEIDRLKAEIAELERRPAR